MQAVIETTHCKRCGITTRGTEYCNRHAYIMNIIINGYKL